MQTIAPKLKSWATIVEPNTLEQARRVSELPFVAPHVALMPDAHLGMGATIGSVIPTQGAIIPSAVGVDIGCVDADSEFLSPTGWVRIADWDGHQVMQYDAEDGTGQFVDPEAYIVKDCEFFYHLKTKYGIDQMLSSEHRVLCWKITGRDRHHEQHVISAEEFAWEHNRLVQGLKADFSTTFLPTNIQTQLALTNEQIRVQVMVNADAWLDPNGEAALHLKKDRKITRACEILTAAGILWRKTEWSDGATGIRFIPPIQSKSYQDFWMASVDQLRIVAEECLHWDGNLDEPCFYTRDREAADFIHYAFTVSGYRAVLREDAHLRDGRIDYRVFAHSKTMIGMGGSPKTPIECVPSPDGKSYCFTVPSGFWVMRRNGNIVMTGNCGMASVQTQFRRGDLGDVGALRAAIERAIPTGIGKPGENETLTVSAAVRSAELEADPHFPDSSLANWRAQLGTLGGGNHFLELSEDDDGYIWCFLHSGSRGVGNKTAQGYITAAKDLAKRWYIALTDPDLAYFPLGDPWFTNYLDDLMWLQRYAKANRAEMMDRMLMALTRHIGEPALERQRIDVHHNYAAQEHHMGRDLWITRKGAIRARAGDIGIIPGSMGTASYVVEGKGNVPALQSAPHGAGRIMSRKQARATIDLAQVREVMTGIEAHIHAGILDEAPQAYKDVDVVMRDAADLVSVKHILRPVLNIKGS